MKSNLIVETIIGKLLKQPEIQQYNYTDILSKDVANFLNNEPNPILEFLKEKSPLVYQELSKEIEEDDVSRINNLGVDFLFNVIYACVKESLNESCVPPETKKNVAMDNWRIYANNVLARNRELSTYYEKVLKLSWIEANNNKSFFNDWQDDIGCPIEIEIDANMRAFRWEFAVNSALSSILRYCSGMKQEESWDKLIETYLHYTKEITEASSIKRDLSSKIDQVSYFLEQLTQMGEIGLSYFFKFCQTDYSGPSEYKFKRNPDASLCLLNGFFDLRGNDYQKKSTFTDYLVRQLIGFYQKEKNPLFKNLRLILPDSNDDQSKTIIKLFQLINEYNYPALAAIKLYNFDHNNELHQKLLDEFHEYAKKFPCKIQVIISELDKFDSDSLKIFNQTDSWCRYKALQNLVLKNRRDTYSFRKLSLATNQVPVDSNIDDQDITWPLNSNIKPSINIQQQQQQQQQQSKIQVYQADFYFRTSYFITRDTIEKEFRGSWDRLSKEIKKFSGHADKDDLSKLFDRWVSGISIAGECIQWIEPEAINVMMDYAPQFRFGLPSESSLPVGFSVKKHPQKEGLVLCYENMKQKPLDIRKREETDKEKRNPFSLKLKNKMAAVFWKEGDCRQLFELITSNEEEASLIYKYEKALILWYALALTEILSEDDKPNYLLSLQAYSLSSKLITPTSSDACELLKTWSGNYTDSLDNKVFNSKFLEYFFNATTLSSGNLKALGQLFYQQGVGQLPDMVLKQFGSGILAFLYLAQSIFNENKNFFEIWKKTFVDTSENLNVLVAASQFRALSDYLMTFQMQNNSYLQNIFWAMVDKQGQTTPYNHFSCLWKPFKSLVCYLNKYGLTLNQEAVGALLKKSIDFQFPIFIERLILTLEKFSDEPSKQRQILAELDSYNWHDKIPHSDYYPDEVISDPIDKSLLSKKDYRVLESQEVDACIQLIKPKLSKVNYDNKVTFLTDFYSKQLTVPQDAEATQIQQLLSAFEKLFLCLDKTQYSNDLTQLMAVLKGTKKTKLDARYAAPYLLFVLRAYLPSKEKREDKSSFYLTPNLNDYLTHELTHQQASSLLLDVRLKNKISSHQEKIEGYLSAINQLTLKQHHKEQLITIILASENTSPDKLNILFNLLKNNQSDLLGNPFYCNLVLLACKESVYKNSDIKKVVDLLEKFHIFSKLFQKKRPFLLIHGSDEWVWYKKITSAYQDSLHHLYEKSLLEEDPIKFWVEHPILQTIPTNPTSTIEEINSYLDIWIIRLALSPLGTCNLLNKQLCQMDAATIEKLAKYVIDHSHRSSEFYQFLLNSKPTENIIHEFETSEKHKRSYPVDKKKINSILANFKYKGGNRFDKKRQQELLNLFNEMEKFSKDKTLDSLSLEDLRKLIRGENCLVKKLQDNPENKENKAHLLAVMREILFRKTSKWLNCTQLLVCLDSATSDKNHNQLYQVKTGEGKSILMAMRAAFLALSGQAVDILSAKEDLVQRDQLEFSTVFEAMGLRSNYVNQYSKPSDYLAKVKGRRYGDINYATIGGLTLFRAQCEWEKNKPIYNAIYPKSNERIVLLDEADHILLDEKTQFNFSVCNNNDETWVYQIISDFFDEHKKQLKEGVSLNKHLKPLVQKIMAAYPHSPKQSNFVTLYSLKEPTQETYLKLKALLCAAAQATYLQKDIDFCIITKNKELHGKMIAERVATILINNQIQQGAIYSDSVHQFLHLRLNKEALLLGDVPNFPIASETQLAVSQNVRQVLTQHYAKIEGFTGTAGDQKERVYLKKNYSLDRIIKVPPDKTSLSKSLSTIFANDETQQIQAICEALVTSREQPILILCQDDAEVSKIHEKVVQTLAQDNTKNDVIAKIRLDLNSQNKKESDLLDEAGRIGSVTFSARMGRGTDIKPKSNKGLKVIRTYLAAKRITKQERGRQGRNGQLGIQQDILNWSPIEKAYQRYERWIQNLVQDTIKKQTEKLKKRYSNSENFDKLVKTSVVMECQRELENGLERIQRAKDNFIAMLSMACHKNLANVDANDKESEYSARFTRYGMHYRDRVIKFNEEVKMKWEETGVEKFKFFVDQVKRIWENIFPDLSFPEIPSEMNESSLHEDGINKSKATPNKIEMQVPDIIENNNIAIPTRERRGGSLTMLQDNRTAQAIGYSPKVKEQTENVVSEETEGMINILQNENIKNLIAKLEEYSKKLEGYSSSLAQAKSHSLFKIISESSKLESQTENIRKIIDEEKATLSKHRHSSVFNCFFNLFFKPTTLANRITSLKLVNDLDECLSRYEEQNGNIRSLVTI